MNARDRLNGRENKDFNRKSECTSHLKGLFLTRKLCKNQISRKLKNYSNINSIQENQERIWHRFRNLDYYRNIENNE